MESHDDGRNTYKGPGEGAQEALETVVPIFLADTISLMHEALAAYCVLRGRQSSKGHGQELH